MNILLDARMIAWPGIGRYTERLLQHLETLDEEHNYIVLMLPADKQRWQATNPRFKAVYADIRPYGLAEQTKLPRLLNRLKPDLVHFLHFTAPLAYRGRFVVTIHDLILLRHQNLRGHALRRASYKSKLKVMRRVMVSAANRAETIITDTQFVKDDIVATLGAPASKVEVIPLASDPLLANAEPITRLNLSDGYLFYVGSFFPYKNIGRLIEALKQLAPTHPNLKLVLAGKLDSFSDRLKDHTQEQGVADHVIFTGYVTNGELVTLYQQAALYVFPSLDEGFGLPGLEAMTQGTPVLAAKASCLPEVYADAAAYCDPSSTDDIARQITTLLADPKKLQALTEAGHKRVKAFSWTKTTQATLAVYRTALSRLR
jgi:glycosyltransferase involved in cell wall biosynthesis